MVRSYYPHHRPLHRHSDGMGNSNIEIGMAVDEEAAIHAYQRIKARKAQLAREEQEAARKPVSLPKLPRFMGDK